MFSSSNNGLLLPECDIDSTALHCTSSRSDHAQNSFQMTKEVALTRLDILVDSILGHATLLTFCKLKILVEYFYTHCRPRWDATVLKSRTIHIDIICLFVCLFDLMRYVAVNNFSVMLGWFSVFLGRTSIKMHLMCLHKDTLTQWLCWRWVLNKHPFNPQSNVLPSVLHFLVQMFLLAVPLRLPLTDWTWNPNTCPE